MDPVPVFLDVSIHTVDDSSMVKREAEGCAGVFIQLFQQPISNVDAGWEVALVGFQLFVVV